MAEATKKTDANDLIDALETKYDALKDKLILDALEKQMGDLQWAALNEQERQRQLMKIKLEQRKLKQEGIICSLFMGHVISHASYFCLSALLSFDT